MANQHDNLKAGLLLIAGIFLAIGVVLVITWSKFQALLQPSQTVAVYYPIQEGLQGLSEGAAVTVGDVAVGSVGSIETHMYEQRSVGHIVRFDIPSSFELGWDARVELVVAILGSSTTLNFRSLGSRPRYDPAAPMPEETRNAIVPLGLRDHPLPPGTIPGYVASTLTRNLISSAMTSVGFEDEQRTQVKSILRNVDTLTANMARRAQNIGDKTANLLENADAAVTDMRELLRSVNERSRLWMARLDTLTASTDETMAAVRDLVVGQSDKIDASVDLAHSTVAHLQGETLPKLDALLDVAHTSMSNVEMITATGRDLVVGQRPVVERATANMHLMAEQLKLTAVEVRRSPWRLLHRPREAELETDNLYDSARSFAQAAASIEAAIASLEALGSVNPAMAEEMRPQLEYLQALENRFKEAEDRFWQYLEQPQ